MLQTFVLKNGIRIVHQEVNSPVSHFGVIINTGSRDEEENEQGIAHFIEHVIFKGTKTRKAFHILNRIEDVGGELNAYTTKEETAVYATFLSEYYQRSVELISDILFNSVFPAKELEREKEVVFEEINSYKDSPSELIFDEFEEILFAGHPIARNILGLPEQIKGFNKDSILKFMDGNYHTDQMVLSSIGNIPMSKIIRLAEKYFGSIPQRLRVKSRVNHYLYKPETRTVQKDTFQSHCIIGNIAPDVYSTNRMTMVLLNNILGGQSMNSRLNMALRERNGMAYNVESNYTAYSDTGEFSIYFGTDKENLDDAQALVYKELQKMQKSPMGIVQLSRAKKQLIGQLAISTETREDLMLSIGKSMLFFNQVDPLEAVFKKIESIEASEIMEIANLVFDVNTNSTLIYL
ncbi:MAG TPA: pitrilysin family protein [Prolixibacteraceae bacterium]|nr:pitrilysin family protein [Prolixibacteraceae bacterium]